MEDKNYIKEKTNKKLYHTRKAQHIHAMHEKPDESVEATLHSTYKTFKRKPSSNFG